jgi:hypothetical protein
MNSILTQRGLLFHTSYTRIEQIDLTRCKRENDFGRGFYLTTSKEQAIRFANAAIRKGGSRLSFALKQLRPEVLENQICLKTRKAIDCLTYLGFEEVEKHEHS